MEAADRLTVEDGLLGSDRVEGWHISLKKSAMTLVALRESLDGTQAGGRPIKACRD